MAGSAGGITTGFNMVNQPNAPIASAADPLAQFANSGATLPIAPNADPRGIPTPSAGMRGGPSNTLAQATLNPNPMRPAHSGGHLPIKQPFTAAAPRPPEASYGGESILTANSAGGGAAGIANAIGSSGALGAPAPAGSGKGGGGAVGQPTSRPTQGQFAPLAPQGGFNVNQAAAGSLQQAMQGTQGAMQGPLAVSQFMNPYTQNVINRTQMDIMRQQQMAENQLGAKATAARAFGGSRQAVAEGVLAGEYGRMAGDIAAQQRQAGYTQALDAAMRDRAARAGYAQQLAGLGSQAFQTGQTIQQQQAQQGLLQQGMQQALIDAARQQYGGYIGAPAAALQAPLAALGAAPKPQTTTESAQPGLYQGLQTLALMQSLCWVAREVYGEDDPRWMEFRDWLVGHSPDWFFNAYDKYGKAVAKVVRKVPLLKSIIRPFMDAKRKAIGYK